MPKFEVVTEQEKSEEIVAREFIAVPVFGGDTTALKAVLADLAARGGTCLVFIADLNPDEDGKDMPLVTSERQTKGGGSSSSVVYAQSTDLFAKMNDEGSPILFTGKLRRKLSGGNEPEITEDDETDENDESGTQV